MSNNYLAAYHPDLILKDPAFKVFNEAVAYDKEQNLSIAYNAKKEIHLVQRPRPVPREGEVVVHIRATYVRSLLSVLASPLSIFERGDVLMHCFVEQWNLWIRCPVSPDPVAQGRPAAIRAIVIFERN